MTTREECLRAAAEVFAVAYVDTAARASIVAHRAATQTPRPPAPGVRADKAPTTSQRRTA